MYIWHLGHSLLGPGRCGRESLQSSIPFDPAADILGGKSELFVERNVLIAVHYGWVLDGEPFTPSVEIQSPSLIEAVNLEVESDDFWAVVLWVGVIVELRDQSDNLVDKVYPATTTNHRH